MKKLAIVGVLAMSIVFYACRHEVIAPGGTGNGGGTGGSGGGTGSSVVCFESEILPIFKSSCAKSGCHDATSRVDDYVFDNYQGIMKGIEPYDADDSEIYEMITETDPSEWMPRNGPRLLQSQIDLIKRWINEGAKNTTGCGVVCDPAVFTFSGTVQKIMDANCRSCHTGASGFNGVDLSTYAGVKAAAQSGKLMPAITHSGPFKMPKTVPDGQRKLDDCQITQIQKWINAGMLNN